MLSRVAVRLSDLTERVVPSAFAIALLLTFVTFLVAIGVAGASLARVVIEWGNGFWTLVPFAMQMALVVLTGYLVSTAPVVDRLFARLASRTRTPKRRRRPNGAGLDGARLVSLGAQPGRLRDVRSARRPGGAESRLSPARVRGLLRDGRYLARWPVGVGAAARRHAGAFSRGDDRPDPRVGDHLQPVQPGADGAGRRPCSRRSRGCCIRRRARRGLSTRPSSNRSIASSRRPRPARWTLAARIDHGRWLMLLTAACGLTWIAWYFWTKGFQLTLDVLNFALPHARDSAASFGGVPPRGRRARGGACSRVSSSSFRSTPACMA